ncbi:MAG: SMI1/KNR4 family protein [Bacteroidia bacterium]|nr:SMI1/KNR4 family protein [Bacteroidia bacterium]MDW8334357.1 SMI1/KNR4 family protein [Bacteroidia bacterium]
MVSVGLLPSDSMLVELLKRWFSRKSDFRPVAAIADFERMLGRSLPQEMRNYLIKYPKPKLDSYVCEVADEERGDNPLSVLYSFVVARFLSLDRNERVNMIDFWKKNRQTFPPRFVPFAVDKFNNLMGVSLDDGAVYFIKWGPGRDGRISSYQTETDRRMYKAAANFDDFVSKLYKHRKFQ